MGLRSQLLLTLVLGTAGAWPSAVWAAAAPSPGRAAAAPSPTRAAAPLASPSHGAIVLAVGPAARKPAKALARLLYSDPLLRPALDEATARTLVGEAPACPEPTAAAPAPSAPAPGPQPAAQAESCSARAREIQEVLETLAQACSPRCDGSSVPRRLLSSLGHDLGAELVIAVQTPDPGAQGAAPAPATAQVLRVREGRFIPLLLSAAPAAPGNAGAWDEVLPIVRSLGQPAAEPEPARPRSAEPKAAVRATAARSTSPFATDQSADG